MNSVNHGFPDWPRLAAEIRADIVTMSHRSRVPHLASALSCVGLLVACYWDALDIHPANIDSPDRDRFILSKGHAAPALYATLAKRGIISGDMLLTLGELGSPLAEQPAPGCAAGVEWATGSLGHGLSAGIGMALAARIQKKTYKTAVLVSDGECNEGSVWEAALFAAAQRLGSLTVLVDYNKWQATGRSNEVMALDPLREKWESFGWESYEVDGHDFAEIRAALACAGMAGRDRPLAIVAHTVGREVPSWRMTTTGTTKSRTPRSWLWRGPSWGLNHEELLRG